MNVPQHTEVSLGFFQERGLRIPKFLVPLVKK